MTTDRDLRAEFSELIERHRGIVFKVASTYAFQADDRADLAQDIATQLWRAYPCYDPDRPFPTWMYRIALNVAISQVRRAAWLRRHAVPMDETVPEVAHGNPVDHEADQQVRALHRFIAQLAPLNRALMLLYLEDQSYRQIAEILGISETNVATKLSRLKQRIRNEL